MPYRINFAQRCVLADCTRTAIPGWLLTDPAIDTKVRRIEYKATTILGFSFSRFASMAIDEIGGDYQAGSVVYGVKFPLSIAETFALANNIELEMATDEQLHAAGIIAAHSPYGQPEVCSRDWRTYVAMLAALGLSIDDDKVGPTGWRDHVRQRLEGFRHEVALAALPSVAAE
jgi:hypothetical protein